VAPGVGYTWTLDEDFGIPGYSVPSLLVLHGGAGYRMFLTNQADQGSIYAARSEDGLTWTVDPVAILRPEDFDLQCGDVLLDVSQVYLADGTYRLLIEGHDLPSQDTTICSAWSADGVTWTIEEGIAGIRHHGRVCPVPCFSSSHCSVFTALRTSRGAPQGLTTARSTRPEQRGPSNEPALVQMGHLLGRWRTGPVDHLGWGQVGVMATRACGPRLRGPRNGLGAPADVR